MERLKNQETSLPENISFKNHYKFFGPLKNKELNKGYIVKIVMSS